MKVIFSMPNSDQVQNYTLNFKNLKKGEPFLIKSITRNQETGAVHVTSPNSIKGDLCGLHQLFSRPFFTQRIIPATEKKWKVIPANSSYGGALSMAVSKMGMIDNLTQHFTETRSILRAFAKHGARDSSEKNWLRLIHERSSKTRFEYNENSKSFSAYFRVIQAHPAGIPIDREMMEYIRISFQMERVYLSQVLFFQHPVCPGERTISDGKESRLFSTPLYLFGGDSDEEESSDDHAIAQYVHYQSHWKRNQDAIKWVKLAQAQGQGLRFLANNVTCDHRYTILCQQSASTK